MLMDQIPFGGGASVGLMPVDLSGGAKSSLYANVRNINGKLAIMALIAAGTAWQNITITLSQAKTSAGGDAKVLNVKEVYFKRGGANFTAANAADRDKFVKSAYSTREVPTVSYVSTTDRVASTNDFLAAIMVNPADLDQANGFTYVRVEFSSPAAAQLGAAWFIPIDPAYEGPNAPSMLA